MVSLLPLQALRPALRPNFQPVAWPLLREPCLKSRLKVIQHETRRTFLSSPPPQTITHSATLPYSRYALYSLIADIESYPHFLPFCTTAAVTRWSQRDSDSRKWPARAMLGIGWGGMNESYESRVYCVPDRIVEAVAGGARTGLTDEELQLYKGISGMGVGVPADGMYSVKGGDVFKSLRTRWELKAGQEGARDATEVDLQIEFEFSNPLYAALSSAAVPKVAEAVVTAFEKRARHVLGDKER